MYLTILVSEDKFKNFIWSDDPQVVHPCYATPWMTNFTGRDLKDCL